MTRILPVNPNLEFLKKQAKHLLQAHKSGDNSVCSTLRLLHRFNETPDSGILASGVTLNEVQFALALEYGFADWTHLKEFVEGAKSSGAGRIDVGDLQLRGNPCTEDTFTIALTAACKHLGLDVDLDAVRMLSGNTLVPAVEPSMECKAWWHNQKQDMNFDLLAAFIGLKVRHLPRVNEKNIPSMPTSTDDKNAWRLEYYRKPLIPALQHALAQGEIVITDREWDWTYQHNSWFGWGFVSEAYEDGTILGVCVNRRSDNPMTRTGLFRAISKAEPKVTLETAHSELLRRTALALQSRMPYEQSQQCAFGAAAIDHWADVMSTVPGFCPACAEGGEKSDRGWTCALDNGRMLFENARFSSSYFRAHPERFPASVQDRLPKIADAYHRIAELLQPAVEGDVSERYQTFVKNLDLQNKHAQLVLSSVKSELLSIARLIDESLPST